MDKRPDSPPTQQGGPEPISGLTGLHVYLPGGTRHMKGVGMFVVSLRGVNFGFSGLT